MRKLMLLFCLFFFTSCTFYHKKPEVKKTRTIPYKITVYKEKKDTSIDESVFWNNAKENAKKHNGLTQFFFSLY